MKCEPDTDSVRLIAETPLEQTAIARWNRMDCQRDNPAYGHETMETRIRFTDPPPPAWAPKVGDLVRVRPGRYTGRVMRISAPPGGAPTAYIALDGGMTGMAAFCLSDLEPIPDEAPPPRRTTRVPAPGEVIQGRGDTGVVRRISVESGRIVVLCEEPSRETFWAAPGQLTPIGPDPKWIEIVLPEDRP